METVPWNKVYSQLVDVKITEEENKVVWDMKGYVVIFNTDFSTTRTTIVVIPTNEFTAAMEKLGAPKGQAIPWFRDNAWREEPRRPEDDPDLIRVANESHLIWMMIDTLTVHRIFWRFAFANADATIQGHFLGGY